MADQYGIRKYLQDNGYADGDVTYDQNRKTVLLRGKDFIKANPLSADDPNSGLQAGSTYADRGALSSALNQYRSMSRSSQADTMLGNAMNTVNQQPFQFKAPAEFKYDAQSDPQYQAALRTAQQNAQTAGNNAMVSLGSRGIGNSSITGDRVAQIQQRELGKVNDTMLPQMMAQAYTRYADGANRDLQTQQANYGAAQDQFRNQTGLADAFNNLNQQQADNTYRDTALADKQKQDRISLANYLGERFGTNVTPTYDAGLSYDQVAGLKPLDVQQFEYGKQMDDAKMEQQAKQFASQQGLDWERLNQQQRQFVAEQSARKDQLDAEMKYKNAALDAQNDPNNLDNQYKRAQIESLTNKNDQTTPQSIDQYDLLMVEDAAKKSGVDPAKAKPEEIKLFVAGMKSKYSWDATEAQSVESYLLNKKPAAQPKEPDKPKPFGYRYFGG